MAFKPLLWCFISITFALSQGAFGDVLLPRLSEHTIEKIVSSPEDILYSELPDSECDIQKRIKRCVGIYIAEVRSYFPQQINPAPKLQASYTIREVRIWVSERNKFIKLTMETRGAVDFVVTDQANAHRSYFENTLPPEQLKRLASENWPSEHFYANIEVETNVLVPSILDSLSEITGSNLRTTLGRQIKVLSGYPELSKKISLSEILLLNDEV